MFLLQISKPTFELLGHLLPHIGMIYFVRDQVTTRSCSTLTHFVTLCALIVITLTCKATWSKASAKGFNETSTLYSSSADSPSLRGVFKVCGVSPR